MGKQDFTRFGIKISFKRISYIVQHLRAQFLWCFVSDNVTSPLMKKHHHKVILSISWGFGKMIGDNKKKI